MKKVLKSLPSVKKIVTTLVVCYVIGLLAAGPHLAALLGLAVGVLVVAYFTVQNYDPMRWEAYNQPFAHYMRGERDEAVEKLRAVVTAFDEDNRTDLVFAISDARHLLSETYPTTPAP